MKDVFFKSVRALTGYRLLVEMATDARIVFDFNARLSTMRFGVLKDRALFDTASTDGDFILFRAGNRAEVRIAAGEFMDLVLVDRTDG